MPVTTPQQKIDKTRPVRRRPASRSAWSATISTPRWPRPGPSPPSAGALFLPPFDDADVIEGQATVALEILEALPAPDLLVVAGRRRRPRRRPGAGDGGARARQPRSASSSRSARRACAARWRPAACVTLPEVDNFVDGAAVARIGDLNFAVLGACPAGGCAARAGEPHLRDDGRDAERRGHGARAGRRAGDRRAARPRPARRPQRGRRRLRRQLRLRAAARRQGAGAALGGPQEILHPAAAAAAGGAARLPRPCSARRTTSPASST